MIADMMQVLTEILEMQVLILMYELQQIQIHTMQIHINQQYELLQLEQK
jgi:hypothetical protein